MKSLNEKEIVEGSSIASLSFGAVRKFAFKHAKTNERLDVELAHGSLLDMKGDIQANWYHSLPKTTRVKQMRINLTVPTLPSQPTTPTTISNNVGPQNTQTQRMNSRKSIA